MRILIDARFYGLENTGIGRYTIKLLSYLSKLDSSNDYLILLRRKYYDKLSFPKNFTKILVDIKHYGFDEQIQLPGIIKKYNPDIVHFLNSNVPINFRGKFIVTIHDLMMYKREMKATTLPLPVYFFKNFIYRKVLKHAVLKSQKIIVPSEFIKDEIIKHFKVPKEKILVTYEGI